MCYGTDIYVDINQKINCYTGGIEQFNKTIWNNRIFNITRHYEKIYSYKYGSNIQEIKPKYKVTIITLIEYNNTYIGCSEFNGIIIQCKLLAVKDLDCVMIMNNIYCNWTEPFSFTSIPEYTIRIYDETKIIIEFKTNSTEFTLSSTRGPIPSAYRVIIRMAKANKYILLSEMINCLTKCTI